jgi:hypothetical protein
MGTVLRFYLAWRVFRLLRSVPAAALIAGIVLTLGAGTHARANRAAASRLERGVAAAGRDLPGALERAFEAGTHWR